MSPTGQVLFTLDRRPLEATLQQVQANLARDLAQAPNARTQAGRVRDAGRARPRLGPGSADQRDGGRRARRHGRKPIAPPSRTRRCNWSTRRSRRRSPDAPARSSSTKATSFAPTTPRRSSSSTASRPSTCRSASRKASCRTSSATSPSDAACRGAARPPIPVRRRSVRSPSSTTRLIRRRGPSRSKDRFPTMIGGCGRASSSTSS